MNLFQLLQTCFRSILRNRMRSLLTSLGIIIGVGSVIIMVAIGEGSQASIEKSLTAMGTNLLQVMPARNMNRNGRTTQMRISSFTKKDIDKLKLESSYAAAITGVVQGSVTAVGPEGSDQVQVNGVDPDFFIARNWNANLGVLFEQDDLDTRNTVIDLGNSTAVNLFGSAEASLGQQLRINTNYYTVIGVLESKGSGLGGNDQDNIIIMPLDTAMTRLNNSRNINTIIISVIDKKYMDAAQKETELILRESRNLGDNVASDFSIFNQAEMIDMASGVLQTMTTLLAAIAGVSLLVGGIGIMNIMLVSVTERTREIGIRMAIGGRKRDILLQFLSESMILSLMGGILGIGLAALAGRLLALVKIPTAINPVIVAIAALFAAVVGIIFGYYPALKAARLYPIDALRYE
ncbi:MAG: ABC transporter permease [Treponema sp.]|nr:ABC transporter permease [Treponema sp.]